MRRRILGYIVFGRRVSPIANEVTAPQVLDPDMRVLFDGDVATLFNHRERANRLIRKSRIFDADLGLKIDYVIVPVEAAR
jgi:hypothetical protein